VAYGEEQVSVSKGEAAQITARGTNGGMLVTGWDRDDYGIKVCKMAAGTTRAEAEARVAAMNLRVSQGGATAGKLSAGWVQAGHSWHQEYHIVSRVLGRKASPRATSECEHDARRIAQSFHQQSQSRDLRELFASRRAARAAAASIARARA
jgi:hypothetical protein